jgi:hypothetical protein
MLCFSEAAMILQRFLPKRTILIFTAALLFISVSGAQESEPDYDKLLVEMLDGYQKLFSTPLDGDVQDVPGSSWRMAALAINKGFLRFTADPQTDSLLRGARFYAEPGKDVTYIVVTRNLLDLWPVYPSTAYNILTMAVRDAAVFFQDPPAWGVSLNDTITRLYIRLDQYTTSAMLVRDRLLPSGYLLSPYDAYILDSMEKDGMASAVLYLERISLPVADGLSEARREYETKPDDVGLRKFVNDLGNELYQGRKNLPSGSPDQEVYPLAAAVHTWLEFSPYLIARIHNRSRADNPLTFDQILAREKDYAETRRLLEASRIADTPMMNHVQAETITGFEKIGGAGK